MTDTDQYQADVAEARGLVKRSEADQWRLAELTYKNSAPFGLGGKRNFAQWGRDIGVDDSYAARLYQMWKTARQTQDRDDVQTPPELPRFADAYKEVSPSSAYQPRVKLDESEPAPPREPQGIDLLSIYNDLAEARRRVRSAFRATVTIDPADNVKLSLLDELGDVETEIEQFRKFLTGMGVEEFIDEIMEGAGGAAS
jgi:hypothetical protein